MTPTPAELERLRAFFAGYVAMPDEVWALGADLLEARDHDAGEHLLRAGEVAEWVWFVQRGVLRQYYLTPDGRERNKSFSVEDEPCGAFHSSLTGAPSRFAVQALEPARVLRVRFAALAELFPRHILWERVGRRAAEVQALINEAREAAFLLDSATERYLRFREDYPGLEGRIAQYHIAAYLGITDVALSRIRRRLREARDSGAD